MLAVLALLTRTAYDFFRMHGTTPWAQAWWSLTYFNAWLMTVNDDPFVWFYYIYGHTTLPPMAFFWVCNKLSAPTHRAWPERIRRHRARGRGRGRPVTTGAAFSEARHP